MRNKKYLGQNFLTRDRYPRIMADAIFLSKEDVAFEIGAGEGILTEVLLEKTKKVFVVEKDEELVDFLKRKFEKEIKNKKLVLIENDIRNVSIEGIMKGKYKLIANIPYYITGEIIRKFLSSNHQPKDIVLMVQKEVAERIIARNKKESLLSISVKAYGEPRIISKVRAGNFNPKPKVDSAIIHIGNISKKFFKGINEKKFFEILRAGFAHKRKILTKNLEKFGKQKVSSVFEKIGVDKKVRAENLDLLTWREVAKYLSRGK